jgi:transcriptional regulator with XRE-family HTH domain
MEPGLQPPCMAKPLSERKKRTAANLRFFREELGISQAKMAAAIGVPANTWSTWEQGGRSPSAEMIYRIAEVLDRSADDIAAEKPEPTALPYPPAVALIQVDSNADQATLKMAAHYVRELNRKHRQRRAKQRQAVDLESFETETDAMEEQAQGRSATLDKATRGAKKR